jgi:hypothetical protein
MVAVRAHASPRTTLVAVLILALVRDRAEERRRGVNPDYESANQLLSIIQAGGTTASAAKSAAAAGGAGGMTPAVGATPSRFGATPAGGGGGGSARAGSSAIATEAGGVLRGVSVEDSKYLGGDLDHTHLVKGLDYALLNKARCREGV